MADKKMHNKESARSAIRASLRHEFPHEDEGRLEELTGKAFNTCLRVALAKHGEVPDAEITSAVDFAASEIYMERCVAAMGHIGMKPKYKPNSVTVADASDFVVLSYILVEREEPDVSRPETLPMGKVTRRLPRIEEIRAAFEEGKRTGAIRGIEILNLNEVMRHFDHTPGFVNAGLYDPESAFRVITDPAHYDRPVHSDDVHKMRRVFDRGKKRLGNVEVLTMMSVMDKYNHGEAIA